MAWIFLFLAGIGEIGGVIGMKLSEGFSKWKPTLFLCIPAGGMSFYFLSLALRDIPIGTAYGIWTGIGAGGSVALGMLLFKESRDVRKLVLVLCIIVSIAGLKFTSGH